MKNLLKKNRSNQCFIVTLIILLNFFYNPYLAAQPGNGALHLSYSRRKIDLSESFRISVHLQGFTTKYPPEFPEIEGFDKSEVLIQQPDRTQGEQVFTQVYKPRSTGIFMLRLFRIRVGNRKISSQKSLMLTVINRQPRRASGPRRSMSRKRTATAPQYIQLREGGALVLQYNKQEVFVGEELEVNLYFYADPSAKAKLEFPEDFYSQVSDISEKLHPATCWEERFGIEKPKRERIRYQGQDYLRYRLYRVLLYPLGTEDIRLPAVSMEMLKPDIDKNYSRWRLAPRTPVSFSTQAVRIPVRPLPEHPLRNQVAVGNFQLKEGINGFTVETGEAFGYRFSIEGFGNLRTADLPTVQRDPRLEVYPPKVEELSYRQDSVGVYRVKTARYTLIPERPGRYSLGDVFSWIYFNTAEARYDTLRASLDFRAEGEAVMEKRNNTEEKKEAIWTRISNRLQSGGSASPGLLWGINIALLSIGGLAVFVLLRKRK